MFIKRERNRTKLRTGNNQHKTKEEAFRVEHNMTSHHITTNAICDIKHAVMPHEKRTDISAVTPSCHWH